MFIKKKKNIIFKLSEVVILFLQTSNQLICLIINPFLCETALFRLYPPKMNELIEYYDENKNEFNLGWLAYEKL